MKRYLMYNVEEAFMATIKSKREQPFIYVKEQIQSAIKKGIFATNLDLEHSIYHIHDIDQLQEFLLSLGYKVERIEGTNDVTRLYIQWTEDELKKYFEKKYLDN